MLKLRFAFFVTRLLLFCYFVALSLQIMGNKKRARQEYNPKIVSEMLGHTTISIILDTYSHVLPNMQSEATKAMENTLS